MTRDQLVAQLAAIERSLNDRLTITRVIVDEQGRELYRLIRSTQRPRTHATQPKERTYD